MYLPNHNFIARRDKARKVESNMAIHKELSKLESKKVKVNSGLMWSLYIIKRGEKYLQY